jgi:hypothetical protein
MTAMTGMLSSGKAACTRSHVWTTGMSRDIDSVPGSAVCMPNVGSASATSRPPARATDSAGRRSTRSVMRDQMPISAVRRLRRPWNGTRPFSTLSPSLESTAGRTVRAANIDTSTTMIVAVANETNIGIPARYMPAIETATVSPEMSTARPEVAAAASTAASFSYPAALNSRARRR